MALFFSIFTSKIPSRPTSFSSLSSPSTSRHYHRPLDIGFLSHLAPRTSHITHHHTSDPTNWWHDSRCQRLVKPSRGNRQDLEGRDEKFERMGKLWRSKLQRLIVCSVLRILVISKHGPSRYATFGCISRYHEMP